MKTKEKDKILFRLEQDEDGYPEADIESIWASHEGEYFRLDNIPFFAIGVSDGDVVQATKREDEWWFDRLISPSSQSTIRVLLCDESDIPLIRDHAEKMGCKTELNELTTLVAIGVPATVRIKQLINFLEAGEQTGRWTYEESALRHNEE